MKPFYCFLSLFTLITLSTNCSDEKPGLDSSDLDSYLSSLPDSCVLLDDFEDKLGDKPDQIFLAGLLAKQTNSPISNSIGFFDVFHGEDLSCFISPDGQKINTYQQVRADKERNLSRCIGPWGKTGNGVHFKAVLNGKNYPHAGFGTAFLGNYGDNWLDFSSLTSISFWAKGYGKMRVSMTTDTILNGYSSDDNWGHFSVNFDLDSQWTYFNLPAKDLAPKPWSPALSDGLKWQDGMKKVCYFEIQTIDYGREVLDSIEVYIDDIQLHGITYETFGVRKP